MRRRAVLCAALAAVFAEGIAAPPAHAAAPAIPSASCPGGVILDGFAGDLYVTLRAVQVDPQDVWICVAVDNGSWLHAGGRLRVTVPSAVSLPAPFVDSGSCTAVGGSLVPGPHPLLSLSAAGLPVSVDAFASATQAEGCLALGAVQRRVLLSLPQVGAPPSVVFEPDPATSQQPPPPPPPSTPSGTCQAESGAQRILDVQTAGGSRAWIYTASAPSGDTDLCAGVNGPLVAYGGRLQGTSPLMPGSAACSVDLLVVAQPVPLAIRTTAAGAAPAVCVSLLGISETATTGSNLGWLPDPGTP
jgi:hypothetical protein